MKTLILVLMVLLITSGCSFKHYAFVHPRYPVLQIPEHPDIPETSTKGVLTGEIISSITTSILNGLVSVYTNAKIQEETSRAESAIGALNSIGDSFRFEKSVNKAQNDILKVSKIDSDYTRLLLYSRQLEITLKMYNSFAETNNAKSGFYGF